MDARSLFDAEVSADRLDGAQGRIGRWMRRQVGNQAGYLHEFEITRAVTSQGDTIAGDVDGMTERIESDADVADGRRGERSD